MATFYTDPSITTRGQRPAQSPWEILEAIIQDRMMMEDRAQNRRLNQLRERQAKVQVGELEQQAGRREAIRGAMGAAVGPDRRAIVPLPMQPGGGSPNQPVTLPIGVDRQAALAQLAGTAPEAVPEMQQQFAMDDEALAQARAETQKALAGKSKAELEVIEKGYDMLGSAAMAIVNAPPEQQAGLYKKFVSSFAASGHPILQAYAKQAPPEWTPELLPQLQQIAMQSLTVKEQVDEQHKRAELKLKEETGGGTLSDFEAAFKREHGRLPTATELEKHKANIAKAGRSTTAPEMPETPPDPESGSILAQTGLSLRGFMALTGRTTQLPRDAATRNAAMKEAQEWANKKGVDVSTLASQYQTYNDVLSQNISRMNRTRIMEDELVGTIENLQGVVNDKDLGRLRFANVAQIWAGQEVNDELAQQYAMHLYQLRNELAAYGAATQGRSGNEITLQDMREAETTIRNGIAKGSLAGLKTAVHNSTEKMGAVLQRSVTSARRAVWELFGVGQNFRGQAKTTSTPTNQRPRENARPKIGDIEDGYRFKGGNPADPKNWEKVR